MSKSLSIGFYILLESQTLREEVIKRGGGGKLVVLLIKEVNIWCNNLLW